MANTAEHLIFNEEPAHCDVQRACSSWAEQLGRLTTDLRTIAGSSEEEFLGIGARLHDFYQRASEISIMSNEVVGRIAGDEVNGAIKGLEEILDRMGAYLNHAEHETDQSSGTFASILGHLDNVTGPLAGFKKINKSLRMLGTSTKIESARLGQSAAGFDTLANDVEQLSVQVIEKSGTILVQKDELSSVIRQSLVRVRELEAEQRDHVRTILHKSRQSLATLTSINDRCSSTAVVISSASTEVSQNISEVVTSMQFHDIVRQQIEHVQEVLEELCGRLKGQETPEGGAEARALICETGDLCELQAAQLRHASEELVAAVESIVENLRGIAHKEAHVSDETRGMAGVADQAGSSFFSEMETDFSVVTEVLADSAVANRNLSEAMHTVAGTVGEIVKFVGDIENIGEEIELIALNAQIKAARTGTEGAALGVLAEAIQRLSLDTRLHTTVVSDTLRNITEVTEGLCNGVSGEVDTLEGEVRGMVSDLGELLQSLRTVNQTMISLLGRMDDAVRSLSSDIRSITDVIMVHQKVAQVLDPVVVALNRTVAEARQLVPVTAGTSAAERLKAVADRYTMHSERKIHAAITGAPVGIVVPAAAQGTDGGMQLPPENTADELGDNVELF